MKTCLKAWLAFLLVLPGSAFAQFTLSGTVSETGNPEPLAGATVQLLPVNRGTVSNAAGTFGFTEVAPGNYTLKVSYVGFRTVSRELTISKDETVAILLEKLVYKTDEVLVTATRANEKTPATFTNVSQQEIDERNFGQDLPYMLQQTPSMVVHSDAGAGVGYTGLRLRGSDLTRLNVTINGIPVNEAEAHSVYFVDMPDLASSVENIQIQRGVGTSTNGAAAFGGSINIKTLDLNPKPYAESQNAYGSYNTWRHSVRFGTGLINERFAFDGRLSSITSDGYIDRASSDLKSYYFSGGYYGQKTMLKFVTFSGKEQTYQAWNGVPESRLRNDKAGMEAHIANNGLNETEAQNLLNSGSRTYNGFLYKNQTDNYQQDYYQLHFNRELSANWNLNTALFYTKGGGYYEEFKYDADFEDYGLEPVVIGAETIESADLVRRRWLKTDLFGATYSAVYDNKTNLRLTLGGSATGYKGMHFNELIWAKVFPAAEIPYRYSQDKSRKQDFNGYVKAEYDLTGKLSLFGDLQNRWLKYRYEGFGQDLTYGDQTVTFNFFNPKAGFTFALTDQQAVYASYAVANREPVRDDFRDSSPQSRPQAENLQDIEAGYRWNNTQGRFLELPFSYSLNANLYYMLYKDQLVLTGEINDVGEYTRTNVKDSYRSGAEISVAADWNQKVSLNLAINLSRNKIKNFTEFIDDYDTGEQIENSYSETDIAFSPNRIITAEIGAQPVKGLRLALIHRMVGDQFLDNTSNQTRKLDAYNVTDFRLRYLISPKSVIKGIEFGLQVNNIFSEAYEANGYTFSYNYGSLITENFYYPQALRNYMVSVGLKF